MKFYFFEREADKETEAGLTISKKPVLPETNFRITDYGWPHVKLWFVDNDKFTATERQFAFLAYVDTYVLKGNQR